MTSRADSETSDQTTDVQADFSIRWAHMSEITFSQSCDYNLSVRAKDPTITNNEIGEWGSPR